MESQGGEVLDAGKGPSFDIHHETKPLPLNALVAGSTQWELQPTPVIVDVVANVQIQLMYTLTS